MCNHREIQYQELVYVAIGDGAGEEAFQLIAGAELLHGRRAWFFETRI